MNARRVFGIAIVALGLLALALPALRPDFPLETSLSLGRKYWTANRTTRLLNSPAFRDDRAFVLDALRIDGALPLEKDVLLVQSPSVDATLAEARRRRAAYLLAPRRVIPVRGDVPAGATWELRASEPRR